MKQKNYFIQTFLIAACMAGPVYAQNNTAYLDTNNVKALFKNNGELFWDGTKSTYLVPKQGNIGTVFDGEIWLGGMDENKQLHMAAQIYRQSGNDFYAGPVAKNYKSAAYQNKYNNIWKLTKKQIDNHKANYKQTGYVMPAVISTWPGTGDNTNGEAKHLAPYIDVNNNGIYDPQNGDYPDIRGDEAVFFIFNDDTIHAESKGQRMKVEVHCMAYAFDKPADTALKNTIFINYKIHNRSTHTYDSVYLAHFIDFDIGAYNDDYVGSDSSKSIYYGYNGAAFDAKYNGPPYDQTTPPPAQGVLWLNTPLSAFVYFKNDFTPKGNPNITNDYYNYMKAIWKDGSLMKDSMTGKRTHFYFNSDTTGKKPAWTEEGVNAPPADIRGVGAVGPFKLLTNNVICLDMAMVWTRDGAGGTNLTSVKKLKQLVPGVKQFYTSQNYSCPFLSLDGVTEQKPKNNVSAINIYPNPLQSDILNVVINSTTEEQGYISITNLAGQQILRQNITSLKGSNVFKLNAQSLASGIYIVSYTNNQGMQLNAKFSKQ